VDLAPLPEEDVDPNPPLKNGSQKGNQRGRGNRGGRNEFGRGNRGGRNEFGGRNQNRRQRQDNDDYKGGNNGGYGDAGGNDAWGWDEDLDAKQQPPPRNKPAVDNNVAPAKVIFEITVKNLVTKEKPITLHLTEEEVQQYIQPIIQLKENA